MAKNLLIGGRGFIGGALRDLLLRKGEGAEVCGPQELSGKHTLPKGCRVFYLAHHGFPGATAEAREARQSLREMEKWLQKLAKLSPRCLVYFSSGGAIYRPEVPFRAKTENSPLGPICHYGRSKVMGEQAVLRWGKKYQIRVMILRPGNVYGPGQEALRRAPGFPAAVIRNVLADQPVTVYGWPGTVRDYVHVTDVSRGAWLVGQRGRTGQAYNLGTGRGLRNDEILEILRPAFQRQGLLMRVREAPGRSADVPHVVLGCSRAARQLGWRPRVIFEQGVRAWVAGVCTPKK